MNEQQVNALLAAMTAQTRAQQEQTAAITRLAESNETLAAIIYQSVADEQEQDLPQANYLSGKPKG